MTYQDLTVFLTAVSALGALGAAIAALFAARATRKSTEAQILSEFLSEYAAPEMLKALRTLRNWKSIKGDRFGEDYCLGLEAGNADAHEVELARRHVKSYFLKALCLYDNRYISKQFIKIVGTRDGVNILYEIVKKLEYALNPNTTDDISRIERLKALCGKAGTGQLIRPIPAGPRIGPRKTGAHN